MSQALAGVVTMDFSSLPSAQGWTYQRAGNTAAENVVFSVSGGVLTQNTMGLGIAPEGVNAYFMSNVANNLDPFQIVVRARVLESEGSVSSNPFGFSFGVYIDNDAYLVGLSPSQIQGINQAFVADIDNTQFHTYEMNGTPGVGFTLFVDGNFVGSASALRIGPPTNGLLLGDSTGGTNARAQVSSFQFRQEAAAIPEPSSVALAGLGILLAVGGFARRHRPSARA